MRLALLIFAVMAFGCGGKQISAVPESHPDFSAALRIVGRFGIGGACPIGAHEVVTAAHMGDLRPFDNSVGLFPYPFSSALGEGIIVPVRVRSLADLALYESVEPLTAWYSRAKLAPRLGETLWWQEYDFDSRDHAFDAEVKKSKVVNVLAGHIILREELEGGASGSCVLNSIGEAVGVVAFGKELRNLAGEVGGVPAIYGDWLAGQDRADAKMREIRLRQELGVRE